VQSASSVSFIYFIDHPHQWVHLLSAQRHTYLHSTATRAMAPIAFDFVSGTTPHPLRVSFHSTPPLDETANLLHVPYLSQMEFCLHDPRISVRCLLFRVRPLASLFQSVTKYLFRSPIYLTGISFLSVADCPLHSSFPVPLPHSSNHCLFDVSRAQWDIVFLGDNTSLSLSQDATCISALILMSALQDAIYLIVRSSEPLAREVSILLHPLPRAFSISTPTCIPSAHCVPWIMAPTLGLVIHQTRPFYSHVAQTSLSLSWHLRV
jgi:hypothetical protein